MRMGVWEPASHRSGVSDLWRKALARLASISYRAASVDARHLLPGRRVEQTSR